MNVIRVITYFSFVENISLKHEMCAVSNAAETETFVLIKHCTFALDVHA